MYESFFGLREKPFSLLPDPGFLYLGEAHANACTVLEYGLLHQAGVSVVSGEVGCGKTTLIRHLLGTLADDVTVGLITHTHSDFGDLLQWVLLAFGLDYRGKQAIECYQTFVDFLLAEYAAGRRTVLIVDEAQNMSAQALEQLRMLSNVNSEKDQLLQLILVGQPELRATLGRAELRQFAQRVAVHFHLDPLGAEDTGHYVAHRLRVAGGDPAIIAAGAREAVYRHSGGVPRLINLLCDTALVYAYGARTRAVGAATIDEVVRDRVGPALAPAAEAGGEEARGLLPRWSAGVR